MGRFVTVAFLALTILGASTPAHAFQIVSAFSNACHEGITLTAARETIDLLKLDAIAVPDKAEWEPIADFLFAEVGDVVTDSDAEKFFVYSVFIGVRSPDTEGKSITNIQSVRNIHASPEGQYVHCLRALEDDYEEGNAKAYEGCRGAILDSVARALEEAQREPGGTIIGAAFSLDHYGEVTVPVWGPGYYIGRAVHTIQDSFTHAVRSDDLRTIYHVMNYAEAIGGTLDERRDGIAHSEFADLCGSESREVTYAALEASADLLRAISSTTAGEPAEELVSVFGKWLEFRQGCTIDNDYCDSKWVERARTEPTGPFLGCTTGTGKSDGRWWLGVMIMAILRRRSTRR